VRPGADERLAVDGSRMKRASWLFVLLFANGCGAFGHPTVTIANTSAIELQQVHLTGRGVDVVIPSIAPGVTQRVEVSPEGETGVALSFLVNGTKVTTPSQGYIEDYDAYALEFTVGPDHTVSVSNSLSAR
jgi:hypothetical protein